jgi:hypothetical protein
MPTPGSSVVGTGAADAEGAVLEEAMVMGALAVAPDDDAGVGEVADAQAMPRVTGKTTESARCLGRSLRRGRRGRLRPCRHRCTSR